MSVVIPSPSTATFTGADKLLLTLKLNIDGTEVPVFGSQIRQLRLTLRSYGFEGELELVHVDDKEKGGGTKDALLAHVTAAPMIALELTVRSVHPDVEVEEGRAPLTLKGLVCERSFREQPYRAVEGGTVLARRYRLRFMDPAQHLWRQHYPCELFTEKSLKQVVDTYKGDKIKISYDTDVFDSTRPLVFLGCQPDPESASFYDWLLWLVDAQALSFHLDYATGEYKIATQKNAEGTPAKLHPEDLQELWVELPEAPRYKVNVLNAYSEDAATKAITNAQAVDPIRHDLLVRTAVSKQVDSREALERSRLHLRKPELRVEMKRFPSDSLAPGDLIKLEDPNSRLPRFNQALPALHKDKTLRLYAVDLSARSTLDGADAGQQLDKAGFSTSMTLRFEQKEETFVRLPAFQKPQYPRFVEAKIVSETGEDDEETYQIYTDSETSIDHYQVSVPLFTDQKIKVPFNPSLFSGHYYFPAYKGERVLVALDLFRGWIKRYLDWRPDARLPADTQGNHLLLGKKPTSSTSLRHVYEDKKPVFKIKRTNEKDNAMIEIKEGTLTIEVKEDK